MRVFVDIDDTICYYKNKEDKMNYEKAIPYKNRIDCINKLYDEGHEITYWTARGTQTGIKWFKTTLYQLEIWGCKFHELRMGKPNYDLFIDDKNIESNTYFCNK